MTIYKAGQSFTELPGNRHSVSANASETQPAKLLAVFVLDTNETGTDDPNRELRQLLVAAAARTTDADYQVFGAT